MNEIIYNKLCESGLSRIEQWMDMHDIACISASRSYIKDITDGTAKDDAKRVKLNQNKPVKITPQENKVRNSQLKARLLTLGYGVTSIDGSYIEGFGQKGIEVSEQSFFVVNLRDDSNFIDNIIELSEYFNQDSVLLKPKGDLAFLYGTNNADFPGYHQKSDKKNYHALSGRFMSRVRKAAFAFANDNNVIIKQSKNDMTSKDNDDYEHEFLFRRDERPTFSKRKENRITSEAKISLTPKCIEMLNEYIDKSILDVRENYKGFRKQNLIGTSNIILENIKKVRNKD